MWAAEGAAAPLMSKVLQNSWLSSQGKQIDIHLFYIGAFKEKQTNKNKLKRFPLVCIKYIY